ncbi:GyrI-like domain-containing protein [Allomuricauda sp. SCSIO 64092]|uniref:GyrI-like domain-containing protein n=1 Tax=Allomuricauda sp. SCSIO 64092 TaxID=2908842 RepID=UPI0028BEF187|nr:GyrI-like domain-containing protein [Muricauda sp. SCSIO 64092]
MTSRMQKHEWRKKEKNIYFPKPIPELINIPEFKFITIKGKGNPNNKLFSDCVGVLYAMSYAIKMNLKKMEPQPKGYCDYTVYPLEGIWDINDEAKKEFKGTINKDELVFQLMIRQPNFVEEELYFEILELTKKRKPNPLLGNVGFERIEEGKCVQMLHLGSYDNESESFKIMEEFMERENLNRLSMEHREIYLTDFRKVPSAKLKTVLRCKVG